MRAWNAIAKIIATDDHRKCVTAHADEWRDMGRERDATNGSPAGRHRRIVCFIDADAG
jgi:hypothetical protein